MKTKQLVISSLTLLGMGLIPPAFAKSQSKKTGDILQYAIPLTGLGIAAAKHDTEGEKQLAETMLVNIGATYGLKYAFNQTSWGERPNGGEYSFPSGHTSTACSGATFIGQRYGWQYGAMAVLPAGYVG